MTVIRVVTDLDVAEVPSDEVLRKVADTVRRFADGVVPEMLLNAKDTAPRSTAHLHAATDYACDFCRNHAVDSIA